MTLYQIIRRLETFALTLPNVRTASDGDVYTGLNDNPELKYGVFFITQNTHQEYEDMDRYGLTLFYIDRLDDTLEDNRLQIQSIGKEVISVILRDFCEEYDIDLPTINYTPFTQKFKDETAGVYAQLTIDVIKGVCADDFSEIISIYQTKTIDIVENGEYVVIPDSGYSALDKVIINVDVPQSGGSGDYDEGFADGYDSGYTDGYQDGLEDCGKDYEEGFEDGYESGVTDQKNKLVSIYIDSNGQYNRTDGYNSITVNVPQTGYTQEDLDNAYASGYTDGLNDCGSVYKDEYLTFDVISGGTIYWRHWNFNGRGKENVYHTIEYSINDGNWQSITSSESSSTITVSAGDLVRFKGDNPTYTLKLTGQQYDQTSFFTGDITCNVYGNIMSLVNSTGFSSATTLESGSTFSGLLGGTNGIIESGITDINFVSAHNLLLPATALTNNCYSQLFGGCSTLISTPKLPATQMADNCYYGMFAGCSSLVTAPALPATTLAHSCYNSMFANCSSLVTAPVLPATVLETSCYISMFKNCTSLVNAPALPATTLTSSCYNSMFEGCTSLVNAPALPATTLAQSCYGAMFAGCSSLTTAPELPATTLAKYCYQSMFVGCSNLMVVKCLATDISAQGSTNIWMSNVNNYGLFIKDVTMNDWTTGVNGIPSGWTVISATE